jgi:hypothetical protein
MFRFPYVAVYVGMTGGLFMALARAGLFMAEHHLFFQSFVRGFYTGLQERRRKIKTHTPTKTQEQGEGKATPRKT